MTTDHRVPGNEFAGTVDAVGTGAAGARVGDEVLGFGQLGAYAEYLTVPADQVTAKPSAACRGRSPVGSPPERRPHT